MLPARLAQSARFAGLFSQGRSIMPLQTPCICSVNVNGRGWHSLTGVACPLARELELPEAFLASTLRTTLTSLLCPVPWLMVGAGNIKSLRLREHTFCAFPFFLSLSFLYFFLSLLRKQIFALFEFKNIFSEIFASIVTHLV